MFYRLFIFLLFIPIFSFAKESSLEGALKKTVRVAFFDGRGFMRPYVKWYEGEDNLLWENQREIEGEKGIDDDQNGYVDDFYGWDAHNKKPINSSTLAYTDLNFFHHASLVYDSFLQELKLLQEEWGEEISVEIVPIWMGGDDTSSVVSAIEYSLKNKVDIINTTYTETKHSREEYLAYKKLEKKGVTLVSAAGNSKTDLDKNFRAYPSNYLLKNVISVGSIVTVKKNNVDLIGLDKNSTACTENYLLNNFMFIETLSFERAGYSNYGKETVDVSLLGKTRDNTEGTSFATPKVTAFAVMVKSAFPNWKGEKIIKFIMDSVPPQNKLKYNAAGVLDRKIFIEKLKERVLKN